MPLTLSLLIINSLEVNNMEQLTKICTKCGIEKPITDFHKAGLTATGKQRYRSTCKLCANKVEAERYQQKRNFINNHKDKCAKCGDTRQYVLDFHHRDETEKEFTIGKLKKKDCQVLQNEINKCILLCANCHREFHYLNREQNITLNEYLEN